MKEAVEEPLDGMEEGEGRPREGQHHHARRRHHQVQKCIEQPHDRSEIWDEDKMLRREEKWMNEWMKKKR